MLARLLLGVLTLGAANASLAGPPKDIPLERNCLWQLLESSGPQIDCEHAAWMTDDERADLRKLTRDYFQDASCLITVKIERKLVDAAIAGSDLVFESPPQPVTCEITTSQGKFPITATFAPHVVFKGGFAVEATPGLANVTGVNAYLAWPVVHYINHADRITKTMLLMINAYRANRGKMQR
jgi:hypothetical protein